MAIGQPGHTARAGMEGPYEDEGKHWVGGTVLLQMMEQLKQTSPRHSSCYQEKQRSTGTHRATDPAGALLLHECHTLPQPAHPNLPSAGHSPGNGSSNAAKICAHVQNLFPPPSGRGRPQFYKWHLKPVPPWMMASPWDASSWAREWIRSEPEHRTSWPSPTPILSSAKLPAVLLANVFLQDIRLQITGVLPQIFKKGGLSSPQE